MKRFFIQRLSDGAFMDVRRNMSFHLDAKEDAEPILEVGEAIRLCKRLDIQADVVDEDGQPYYMHRIGI